VLADLTQDLHMGPWEKMERVVDYYVDRMLDNRNFHTIMSRQISLVQEAGITEMLIEVKRRNTKMIADIIREGQAKKIFGPVDIALTIGTVMGLISQVSMSRPFYSRLLKLDPNDDAGYFKKMRPRLKTHLKSLLRAHLATGPQS
jgi:hypothetical protein